MINKAMRRGALLALGALAALATACGGDGGGDYDPPRCDWTALAAFSRTALAGASAEAEARETDVRLSARLAALAIHDAPLGSARRQELYDRAVDAARERTELFADAHCLSGELALRELARP